MIETSVIVIGQSIQIRTGLCLKIPQQDLVKERLLLNSTCVILGTFNISTNCQTALGTKLTVKVLLPIRFKGWSL